MRNKIQARDRRRGEVEEEMDPEITLARQLDTEEAGARRLVLLFAWLELASSGQPIMKAAWRRTEQVLEEIRREVGNGPTVQAATAGWLERGLCGSRQHLDGRHIETGVAGTISRFIGNTDDKERLTALDLDTYERWLKLTYIPRDKLEDLRRTYWRLLLDIARIAENDETASLRQRVRDHIASAYWRGTRDCENEQGYRCMCRELGIDPGPVWIQIPQALLGV